MNDIKKYCITEMNRLKKIMRKDEKNERSDLLKYHKGMHAAYTDILHMMENEYD